VNTDNAPACLENKNWTSGRTRDVEKKGIGVSGRFGVFFDDS
jgi:hypothetical protein